MMKAVYHTFSLGLLNALVWPNVFSIVSSLAITLYAASMLYFKVVKPEYGGSWRAYFKSILKHLKK